MDKKDDPSEDLNLPIPISDLYISLFIDIADSKAINSRILGLVERIYSEITNQDLESIKKESDEGMNKNRNEILYDMITSAVDDEATKEKIIEQFKANEDKE